MAKYNKKNDEERRDYIMRVRLSERERTALNRVSKLAGLSNSEFIRLLIFRISQRSHWGG